MVDDDGVEWWNFLFSYEYEGKQWSFEICARTEDEALERQKLVATAEYDGQQHGRSLTEEEFEAVAMTTVGIKSLN